ncbi:MAG: DUF262 domain-containing protein [Sulfurovum sp.]|nr:MAG: DUF262 domain-containing protein [Sulfurovum sp.]
MALALSAEQKNILDIFKIDAQYVIPEYQRPYSWEYDQCFQLYNDLVEAFQSREDYFIGNLIIAKSEKDNYTLDVVDGQQRLTTLLLMLKVLSLFTEDELFKNDLKQILGGMSRKTRQYEYRINSEVFESDDKIMLDTVLQYTQDTLVNKIEECINKKGEFQVKKEWSQFIKNSLYFFDWFTFFQKNSKNNLDDFIAYLLEKVYLLPIELRGQTKEEANEKALVIFETINNRGMNLEDADIFKAKLYKRAEKIGEKAIFIDLWKTFKNSCENLTLDIDDVFRYYSHIIRGEQGITSNEINLREFFTLKDYSPFSLKKYKEVMNDLNHIIEVLDFIHQEKQQSSELAKWIQLIEAYTNQYPKFALIVYFYKNPNFNVINYSILESIVRYAYYHGSTAKVKFEIFTIIKKICNKEQIDPYYKEISIDYLDYLGILKNGYALLAFYSDKEKSLPSYSIDKIINLKDDKVLDWEKNKLEFFVNSLGNFIVLDMPKKNLLLEKKIAYYQTSNDATIQNDSHIISSLAYSDFIQRDRKLKEKLVRFFKGE